MEEEFIRNQERLKPQEDRHEVKFVRCHNERNFLFFSRPGRTFESR